MSSSLEDDFASLLGQAETVFKEVAMGMQNEIVDRSPVDKGGFKTAWRVEDYNPKTFTFVMSNNVDYADRLWKGSHSKKGWGEDGGEEVVKKWDNILSQKLGQIV